VSKQEEDGWIHIVQLVGVTIHEEALTLRHDMTTVKSFKICGISKEQW